MQACLIRLYMDESFRRLAVLEPDATLKKYDLTEGELNTLKSLDKQALDFFAVSLRDKRRERMGQHYPLVFSVVPLPKIERYYDRFYSLYGAKPEQHSYQLTLGFGQFLEQTLSGDKEIAPWLVDLARYERLYNGARLTPPSAGLRSSRVMEFPVGDKILELYPSLEDAVYVGDFDHELTPVVAALRNNQKPPEAVRKPSYMVFKQLPDSRIPKVLELSPELWQLLTACDGSSTVGSIIASLEKQWNTQGLKDDLVGALQSMYAERLVKL